MQASVVIENIWTPEATAKITIDAEVFDALQGALMTRTNELPDIIASIKVIESTTRFPDERRTERRKLFEHDLECLRYLLAILEKAKEA